jgi:alkyl sulfatase BDS1-like metallo-beta-lactamase superfamily hydrolase
VFAEPDHAGAKAVLTDALTRLGYGSECATWRNNYLVGASEVDGPTHPAEVSAAGMASALTITQVFDSIAIRIDGPQAWDTSASIRWHFTDVDETYRMELSNGVLIHYPTKRADPADLLVTLTTPQLLGLVAGSGAEGITMDGDPATIGTIVGLTDQPDPAFRIVTP